MCVVYTLVDMTQGTSISQMKNKLRRLSRERAKIMNDENGFDTERFVEVATEIGRLRAAIIRAESERRVQRAIAKVEAKGWRFIPLSEANKV